MRVEYDQFELYGRSNHSISVELGERFKSYRIALRLTQKEIAEHAGVSVMTVVRFENGEADSLGLDKFIALLRCIQRLEPIFDLIPEIPSSLYDIKSLNHNSPKRVRRKRNEK